MTKYCPHCNEPLINVNDFDRDFTFSGVVISFLAKCPTCGKSFTWEVRYALQTIEDLVEEEDPF